VKHATGGDMFEIQQSEIFYVYSKVKRDIEKACTFDTDRALIASTEPLEAIVAASKDDSIPLLLAYAEMLVKNLKPEYIFSLRASLRSTRSRARRQYSKDMATSMTISTGTQERINNFRIKFGKDGKKLTQEQVIVMAMDLLDLKSKK